MLKLLYEWLVGFYIINMCLIYVLNDKGVFYILN